MRWDPDRIALGALLLVISVLLAGFELMWQLLYIGPVPVPVGTVLVLVSLPWLVHQSATELWPTTAGAAAPVLVWFLSMLVLGLFGPGGDVLLPATWQSLLLLFAGAVAGVVSFRREAERLAGVRA